MSDPLGRHALGSRVQVEGHMCPQERCGWPPYPFCPVCGGAGVITELELALWQRRQYAEHPEMQSDARPERIL